MFFQPALANNCPNEFNYDSKSYCLNFEWQKTATRKKQQGEYIFTEAKEISPVLNAARTRSRQRIYSKARIEVWQKTDPNKNLVYLDDLSVAPIMIMPNEMSHLDRANFSYDRANNIYILSELYFYDMPEGGCWRLVLDSGQGSKTLMNVDRFSNLNFSENLEVDLMCSLCQNNDSESHSSGRAHGHSH